MSGKVQATIPTAMTSSQQDTLKKLKGLQGDDFTKQYHSDQQDAHEDAVDLFKRYGDGGDSPDLKAGAASTLPCPALPCPALPCPALEHHLQMATDLNK